MAIPLVLQGISDFDAAKDAATPGPPGGPGAALVLGQSAGWAGDPGRVLVIGKFDSIHTAGRSSPILSCWQRCSAARVKGEPRIEC